MKNITIPLSLVVLSLGLATASMAQDAGPVGGAPKPLVSGPKHQGMLMVERQILEKLNLSPEQKTQFKETFKKIQGDMKALRAQAKETFDKSALKAKRQAIRKEYEDSVAKILTPDQLKQYRQIHKEMKEKAAANKAGGKG